MRIDVLNCERHFSLVLTLVTVLSNPAIMMLYWARLLTKFTNIVLFEEVEGQAISVESVASVNRGAEHISSGSCQ
jgi:hypothetical protein